MKNENSTIASISTSLSPSGIGIIRISGEESFNIINKIFTNKNKNPIILTEKDSYKIHYGFIYDKKNDKFIDEVLVLSFTSNKSFTREDVIEIQAHGGIYLLQKILKLVLENGAILAQPGEFTKRAFLNGRIDLSQAEAVIDIINSENDYAIESSINQLKGNIKNKISLYKNNLLEYTAFIEACLDDPEHMDIEGYKETLKKNLSKILEDLNIIIKNYDDGKIIKEGINTVILGKPNVGKSSLLNLLLNENRAIVTDIAGTTRDIIKESINLSGMTLHIIDTAGLRNDGNIDEVEKIGINKAKEEAKKANLILLVIDSTDTNIDEEKKLLEEYYYIPSIVIFNKIDLSKNIPSINHEHIIKLSTKTKEGLSSLINTIKEMFIKKDLDFNNQIYLSNVRQLFSIKKAKQSIENVINTIENNLPEDLYTIDLMDAISYFSDILGEEVSDDLINTIFSKFCMGK